MLRICEASVHWLGSCTDQGNRLLSRTNYPYATYQEASVAVNLSNLELQWSENGSPVTFGIPRLQQYFRTILRDYNFIAQKRLSPDNESFYDLLTAFIYCCIILYEDSDASSEFVTWLHHIAHQSRSGSLDREDSYQLLAILSLKYRSICVEALKLQGKERDNLSQRWWKC